MISGSVDNVISAAALPYLFGMRLLYPGFSTLVSSFNLKRPGGTRPGPVHRLGSSIGSGRIFPGLRPSPGCPHLSILSGSLLIFQDAASILCTCFSGRFWRQNSN